MSFTRDELFNDIFGERRPDESPSKNNIGSGTSTSSSHQSLPKVDNDFAFDNTKLSDKESASTGRTLDPARNGQVSQTSSPLLNPSSSFTFPSVPSSASVPASVSTSSVPQLQKQQQQQHPYRPVVDQSHLNHQHHPHPPAHHHQEQPQQRAYSLQSQPQTRPVVQHQHSSQQPVQTQYPPHFHTHNTQQPLSRKPPPQSPLDANPQLPVPQQQPSSQPFPNQAQHHQQRPHQQGPPPQQIHPQQRQQLQSQYQRQQQMPPHGAPVGVPPQQLQQPFNPSPPVPAPQQKISHPDQYQQQAVPPHLMNSINPTKMDVQKQRLQPITTDISNKTNVQRANYQQSSNAGKTSSLQQRSPILQQGMNFFSRSGPRNVTSPTINSNGTWSSGPLGSSQRPPPSPNRSMSLNSQSLRSFRSSDNLQSHGANYSNNINTNNSFKTSSGRVIPQKFDMSNQSTTGLGLKTRSFSSISKNRRVSSTASLSSQRVSSSNSLASRTIVTTASRPPKVYPAILSRVAILFRKIIILSQHNKDGLEYRDSFTGSEAVDAIAFIIRTTDRNLALLLGRALDAQKFFHDVTYEHRLRDSMNEVYQFDEVYVGATTESGIERSASFSSDTQSTLVGSEHVSGVNASATAPGPAATDIKVNGVFTLLTECYSPTCTRDALCYSIACPRRLEQQARLNMKPQGGLKRNESHASLHDEEEKKQLWSHTVPKQLLDSLDKKEVKRQELIYEVVSTERTFLRNLEYLRDYWIRPLRESNIIPLAEREKFIRTVFFNVIDILNVATRFRDALVKRQQLKPVVENIGDIFLEFIPYFEPFVSYNAGQCFAKYELERQKAANPLFKRFIEETERLPESNRLNISSYLSQATTRTVRYNLLLKDIIKNTKEDSFDLPDLKKASDQILKLLERINIKVGKAEDRHALILLKQRLVFRPGEYVDLKLGAENRKILYTAPLKRKNQDKDNQGDIHVYLLDHVLLFVRVKVINKREQHKVFQRPIPLPLLYVSPTEEMPSLRPLMKRAGSYAQVLGHATSIGDASKNPISFAYVGRRGYELTLYGATNSAQESLISVIEQQQNKLRETNDIFTLTPLAERFFDISNRINCLVPYDGGRKLLYGTDSGVFTSEVRTKNGERIVSKPQKVISKMNVTQLEVLEEYQTLLALADKKLYAWPLEILITQDKKQSSKEIMSHVSFFKVGVCGGKMLVCAAKSDLIRVFEPSDPFSKKMSKKKFKNETREFHFSSEPVSISFLKTRLIVGCTKGFEIVSLSDGKIEAILDPADTSLDFITNREGLKPLAIHRISSNFLLSYSDFSFFINKNGWRTRSDWMINWEGIPQSFALWYPHLLAFESNFIEIRHVESGELLRVILGENIRLLHMGSQEILYAYEDERGYDVVASLDFWDKTAAKKSGKLTEIKEVDEKKMS